MQDIASKVRTLDILHFVQILHKVYSKVRHAPTWVLPSSVWGLLSTTCFSWLSTRRLRPTIRLLPPSKCWRNFRSLTNTLVDWRVATCEPRQCYQFHLNYLLCVTNNLGMGTRNKKHSRNRQRPHPHLHTYPYPWGQFWWMSGTAAIFIWMSE